MAILAALYWIATHEKGRRDVVDNWNNRFVHNNADHDKWLRVTGDPRHVRGLENVILWYYIGDATAVLPGVVSFDYYVNADVFGVAQTHYSIWVFGWVFHVGHY